MLTDEKRTIEEVYESATVTSDLTLSIHRRGAADVLIASGWSMRHFGGEIHRLHSKWVSAKPRPMTDDMVTAHAATLPKKKDRADIKQARKEVRDAYMQAMEIAASKLPGRTSIIEHLKSWASTRGVDATSADKALNHWLSPTCPVCDGHGKRKVPDTPVLGVTCWSCDGSGEMVRPYGSAPLLGYIKDALNDHREQLKKRLRQY